VSAKALGRAKERGVDVHVILDKSNEQHHIAPNGRSAARYSGATYLSDHGITPLIDDQVRIAHNKVMIIDGETVVTGSFNFTVSAQRSNAENVLIIRHDPAIAAAYRANWLARAAVARPWHDFRDAPPQP
jgi:phosphatidylserine/phosphatidylglycerophosphate/cardiolipin synthase-like enzyme